MKLSTEQKEIIELRKQGLGFRVIEKTLGLKPDKAKGFSRTKWFKENHPKLTGYMYQQGLELTQKTIEERIKEGYPEFEYVGGYEGCESKIKIRCLKCDRVSEKNAQFLRKEKNLTCRECPKAQKEQRRIQREKERAERALIAQQKKEPKIKTLSCKECGTKYETTKNKPGYCTEECKKRFTNRYKEVRKRRMKANGPVDYGVTLQRLIKRDKGICNICGRKVDIRDCKQSDSGFVVGFNYPTIDHIEPIKLGGLHQWDNVQLAHFICNSKKQASITHETPTGQLVMAL